MKKLMYRAVAIALVILCTFVFFGCEDNDRVVQNGISVSDDIKYSQKTEQRASEVIFSILEELYTRNGLPSLPVATKAELQGISEDIRKITVKNPISENQYNAVLDVLEEKREFVIDELFSAFGGEGDFSLAETKTLYFELSKHTGADYVGGLLYNLCHYGYDYNYKKSMELYEKYGYAWYLEDAAEYKDKLDALELGVGENDFINTVKLGFMTSEVFLEGGFEDERIQSFSNEEILVFLKHVKFSSLTVTEEGWRLLSSYFVPGDIESVDGCVDMILYTANENGDLDELCKAFNNLIDILAVMQENLDGADAEYMRSGEYSELLSSAFSKLREKDWEKIETLSSIPYEKSVYEDICESYYGEDFINYSLNIKSVTLAELRASVGSDEFCQNLEGYVAGIYPAFAYLLHI